MLSGARDAALRTVFLLIGAAICYGFVAIDFGLATLIWGAWPGPVAVPVLAVLVLVPPSLLGLVPGIRELEVQASRSLLSPAVALSTASTRDRRTLTRAAGFALLHLVLGGIAGTLLVVAVPWLVIRAGQDLPTAAGSAALLVVAIAGVVATGVAMSWLASRLLGPSAADRLLIAEERLRDEQERLGLARDLHDGIGHALSIIALQAAAGRQVIDRDPARAEQSLDQVMKTARDAMSDLDEMIRVLRDDAAAPHGSTLEDVAELVESYRATGMRVSADLADLPEVPDFASREAFRIVQEALSNSRRHGSGARADLSVRVVAGTMVIEVRNPSGQGASPGVGGHGLAGLRERVAVFGGTIAAEPVHDEWQLRAELPLGVRS
jgi:signal transduction histidine kinase